MRMFSPGLSFHLRLNYMKDACIGKFICLPTKCVYYYGLGRGTGMASCGQIAPFVLQVSIRYGYGSAAKEAKEVSGQEGAPN